MGSCRISSLPFAHHDLFQAAMRMLARARFVTSCRTRSAPSRREPSGIISIAHRVGTVERRESDWQGGFAAKPDSRVTLSRARGCESWNAGGEAPPFFLLGPAVMTARGRAASSSTTGVRSRHAKPHQSMIPGQPSDRRTARASASRSLRPPREPFPVVTLRDNAGTTSISPTAAAWGLLRHNAGRARRRAGCATTAS